jgi:hypothetical protein
MLTALDLMVAPPPPKADEYLIYPWLQPGRLLLMVGPTEIGKTTLTLELIAQCLRGGLLWGRYPVKKITKILYLHGEHSINTIQEIAQKRGDIPTDTIFIVHEFGDTGSSLLSEYKPNLSVLAPLVNIANDIKPQLIIVEPLSAFLGNTENDNTAARAYINLLNRFAARYNAAVLTHHHPGKSYFDPDRQRPQGIATGEARGAMAFEDAAERVLYLKRERSHGEYLRIETPKPKGYPVAPVRLERNEETLQYSLVNAHHPETQADVIGLFAYRLEHPQLSMAQTAEVLRTFWKCSPSYVYQLAQRGVVLGLLDHTDYTPLPRWRAQVEPQETSE